MPVQRARAASLRGQQPGEEVHDAVGGIECAAQVSEVTPLMAAGVILTGLLCRGCRSVRGQGSPEDHLAGIDLLEVLGAGGGEPSGGWSRSDDVSPCTEAGDNGGCFVPEGVHCAG